MFVWLVYQWRGDEIEFQGVFSSLERAVQACLTDQYCVTRMRMDEQLPSETVTPNYLPSWFPLSEPKPEAFKAGG